MKDVKDSGDPPQDHFHEDWVKLVTRPTEILLVEDDPEFVELLLLAIKGYHCCPTVAPDGETAIALLNVKSRPFDLVIVDYNLPRMSGHELLNHIYKRTGDLIPVVVLSGYVTSEIIVEISKLGVVPFVYKPTFFTRESFRRFFLTMGIKPSRETPVDCGPGRHK